MAYANLSQVLALSKRASDAGLEIQPFPKLKSQSNTHIAEFNADVVEWLQTLVAAIKKALTEQVRESFDTGSFGSGGKGEKGDTGSSGAAGATGATGPAGANGADGIVNLTIGAGLDPNGVVVGAVKDLYKSAVSLGGDGSWWVKVTGSGDTGWED